MQFWPKVLLTVQAARTYQNKSKDITTRDGLDRYSSFTVIFIQMMKSPLFFIKPVFGQKRLGIFREHWKNS